ncbi:MAG: hypothetical protein UGF45_14150 [Massilioclostridium sp.]|nr:hypothetical protein [Massilioclostridium sp.]
MFETKLSFNATACTQGLQEAFKQMADELIEEYESETRQQMMTSDGKDDISRGLSNDNRALLHREIIGGAWAIMDAYGTGSEMSLTNPALAEYRNSSLWNPARNGSEIVGRPVGTYTDIFGEQKKSTGKKAGVNLEGFYDTIPPSNAFEQALAWLRAGNRMETKFQKCISTFNFSRYFTD